MTQKVNRAKMSTATAGTGTVTLGAAVSGFQTFAAAGVTNGAVVRYVIENGLAWEIGTGTYSTTGPTLTRTLISSSTGSLLSLAGSSQVYIAVTAEDLNTLLTSNGSATAPSHSFDASPDTGMYSPSTDVIRFSTNGTDRFEMGTAGQLGIGGATYGILGEQFRSGGPSAAPAWSNAEYWKMLNAASVYNVTTPLQSMFGTTGATPTTLTLPVGVYTYEAFIYITGMSATTGNIQFSFLGSGTAVTSSTPVSIAIGQDSAIAAGAAMGGSYWTGASSNATIVTTGIATAVCVFVRGSFRISTAGTIIPSIALLTAAAASAQPGTYFACRRLSATNTDISFGPWT